MNKAETEQAIREAMKPWREAYPEFGKGNKLSLQVDFDQDVILSVTSGEECIVFSDPIDFAPYFKDKP